MIIMRNLIIAFLFLQIALFASVTVLPTQGKIGDEFNFKVTLPKEIKSLYSDIYLRIFEDNDNYYDYIMNQDSDGNYILSISIHEKVNKKEFMIGMQDHHGQIHWKSKRDTFRVLDNTQSIEIPIMIQTDISDDCASQSLHNALTSLHKKTGYTTWNGIKKFGRWVNAHMTYCARFVRMCFGEEGKYHSAIAMFNHFKKEDVVQTEGTPPKGSVVFYATRSKHGHTGIADGEGGLYSASSYIKGVKHDETFNDRGKYLGYVAAYDFKQYY